MEAQYIKNVKIVNDLGCSWINDLDRRSNIKNLDKDKSCDWFIKVTCLLGCLDYGIPHDITQVGV